MKTIFSITSLALILHLFGCDILNKSDPQPLTELQKLPNATQTGQNTLGCLINGKAYVAASTVDVIAIYQLGVLQLGSDSFDPYQSVGFHLYEKNNVPLSTLTYALNNPPSYGASSYRLSGGNLGPLCTTWAYSGSVTFTKIDRTKFIISGTFEFNSASPGCDTLKISNGRFDISYIP